MINSSFNQSTLDSKQEICGNYFRLVNISFDGFRCLTVTCIIRKRVNTLRVRFRLAEPTRFSCSTGALHFRNENRDAMLRRTVCSTGKTVGRPNEMRTNRCARVGSNEILTGLTMPNVVFRFLSTLPV